MIAHSRLQIGTGHGRLSEDCHYSSRYYVYQELLRSEAKDFGKPFESKGPRLTSWPLCLAPRLEDFLICLVTLVLALLSSSYWLV